MRLNLLLVLGLCIVCELPRQAVAGNALFLEGDAFFHTYLRKDCLKEPQSDECVFKYALPRSCANFGDAFGEELLRIKGHERAIHSSLASIYRQIRKYDARKIVELPDPNGGPDEIIETNPIHVFIYNRDYDPTAIRPFLRYNEKWFEECEKYRVFRNKAQLFPFVKDDRGREWRDATLVAPFAAVKSKDAYMEIAGDKIKFLVLTRDSLEELAVKDHDRADAMMFVLLPNERPVEFALTKGRWREYVEEP
jgi:hypothetical protein